jgi:hypothetical protein
MKKEPRCQPTKNVSVSQATRAQDSPTHPKKKSASSNPRTHCYQRTTAVRTPEAHPARASMNANPKDSPAFTQRPIKPLASAGSSLIPYTYAFPPISNRVTAPHGLDSDSAGTHSPNVQSTHCPLQA